MNLINEYADRKIIIIQHAIYKGNMNKIQVLWRGALQGACVWGGVRMPNLSQKKWNMTV